MRLAVEQCLALAATERVARLGTASAAGLPHLVPVTFVVAGRRVFVGIDEKPKTSMNLKRMRNIRENPQAGLLWDRYDEDWSKLWWVRADGAAEVLEDGIAWADAWAALNDKYPQYQGRAHQGSVVSVTVNRWTGWAFHRPDGT